MPLIGHEQVGCFQVPVDDPVLRADYTFHKYGVSAFQQAFRLGGQKGVTHRLHLGQISGHALKERT